VPVFLLTDIERSTQLWERHPDAMESCLRRHDSIIEGSVSDYGGEVIKHTGDGFFAVFREGDPLGCALAIQVALQTEDWQGIPEIRVRMALHAGTARPREGDYFGSEVNRTARLLDAGWGGQILLSSSALEYCGIPEGAAIQDLGIHMLKDLEAPIRIFGLRHADLRLATFPPLRTLSSRPNNLPAQVTPFIGRKREIGELRDLLLSEDCRLVTVTGIGGIGKSRLALQVASELLEQFDDGVFFVPLAGIRDPELAVPAVANALGLSFSGREDSITELLRFLRGKSMLLVIDNFEHVPDAADMVSAIVRSAPKVKIMVTSRSILNLTGEYAYELEGLEFPPPSDDIPLTEYSSVELFLDSMRRHAPSATTDESDLQQILGICRLVAGVPLGIELAAAWVRVLTFREILGEIRQSLELLTSDRRDAPGRHRSIRSVFDYSWELLDGNDRNTFRDVSVFRGGFTRDAAREVCGTSIKALRSLADKSLLRKTGEDRFAIHELLREYAREKAMECPDRMSEVTAAHAACYCSLLRGCEVPLRSADARKAVALLAGEMDNISKAFDEASSRGMGNELRGASSALYSFLMSQGFLAEGENIFRKAADALSVTDPGTADILRICEAGFTSRRTGYGTALAMYEEMLPRFRESGDRSGEYRCLYGLGACRMRMGAHGEALRTIGEALGIASELGDTRMKAQALLGLGDIANHTLDLEGAREHLHEAMALFESIGDCWGQFACAVTLSNALANSDDAAEAEAYSWQALRFAGVLGDRNALALALSGAADSSAAVENWEDALEYARRSTELYDEHGSLWGLQISLFCMAKAHASLGSREDALESLERGLAVTAEIGPNFNSAESYIIAGSILEKLDQNGRALEMYDRGIRMCESLGVTQFVDYARERMEAIGSGSTLPD
jgi:predicted ATPase/class 3 adenylate cyclase